MEESPRVYEWQARISGGTGDGSGAFLPFPWNPKECFGKANLVPVRAEFDGLPYRGIIANMGSGPCIVMLKEIRARLGKDDGDTVTVRVWHDTEPRTVEAPDDLAEALAAAPAAQQFWDRLSPGNRRLYEKWITEAKRAETRAARVAKAVEKLTKGDKVP